MKTPPLLAVERLSATPPGAGAPVLRDISLEVRPGERVVLTGPSGSGKSTLLRCMVLLEPARGRVLLEGKPVGPEDALRLRRRVGYAAQRPAAIDDTVGANLAFPGTVAADALSPTDQRRLLNRLGLEGLELDRRFDALSGGEQQRVALVRSLSSRPQVLLLDEPTASLDPENVSAVLDLLRDWLEGDAQRALLWVSHHADHVAGLASRRVGIRELGA